MKTFEVLKVLNHNVLLGVNQGKEYILTGKGIGFQMKPGLFVNEEKISNFHLIQDSQKLSDYETYYVMILENGDWCFEGYYKEV